MNGDYASVSCRYLITGDASASQIYNENIGHWPFNPCRTDSPTLNWWHEFLSALRNNNSNLFCVQPAQLDEVKKLTSESEVFWRCFWWLTPHCRKDTGKNGAGKTEQEKLSKRPKDRAGGDAAEHRSVEGVWQATSSQMLLLSGVFGGSWLSHALGDSSLQLFPD